MLLLEAINLHKRYRSGENWLEVLKGINLSITTGEIISIVGPSGAGKSTLLHLLGFLDRPTAGEVRLNQENVLSLSDSALASIRNLRIGFLFQFHHLLPEFTAVENVIIPQLISGQDKKVAWQKAEYLLNQVGLSARGHHKPGELSGGEQQRVALARALVNDPAVVLADEPTGNLDGATGAKALELLWQLNEQKKQTFILVTHDESIAHRAHRLIRLVEGQVVEEKKL
ncbi:MAG: ABC transporter ATP-binding protein [bacterium]|nr:ABC transporter ATP-binding protein [bacterium]